MSDQTGRDGRRPLTSRSGEERPVFGVSSRGRLIVVVAVVSASAGMFLFLGGFLGGLFARRAVPIWIGAGTGALVGVLLGARLALSLADIPGSRRQFIATSAGGIAGLVLGIFVSAVTAQTAFPFGAMMAMLSPGAGAAIATAVTTQLPD